MSFVYRPQVFNAVFDGDGAPGTPPPAPPAPPPAPPAPPPAGYLSQAQVNAILAKEKNKYQADLEGLKNLASTTAETKAALETQLEELRNAGLSDKERAALEQKKLETKYKTELETITSREKTWQTRFQTVVVTNDINTSAVQAGVLPAALPFVRSYLGDKIRVVEIMGEDGKPTGDFETKVKLKTKNAKGVETELDYSVSDALALMREDTEAYGFAFQANSAGGLGGRNGQPGQKANPAKMTTSEFMAAYKKDRSSVGL